MGKTWKEKPNKWKNSRDFQKKQNGKKSKGFKPDQDSEPGGYNSGDNWRQNTSDNSW